MVAPPLPLMMLQSWQRNLLPIGRSGGFDALTQLPVMIGAALILWYLAQRILAGLLIRKATAFCPECFGGNIRRVPRRSLNLLLPFVPPYACVGCGNRFLRGRKPPFARCPKCRSAELQPSEPVNKVEAALAALGGQEYLCRRCGLAFRDSRPLRASVETPVAAIQEPGGDPQRSPATSRQA